MAVPFQACANDIYEWTEDAQADAEPDEGIRSYLRILHVPPQAGVLCYIRAPDRGALTEWMAVDEFAAHVVAGRLALRRPDPLAAGARATADLTQAERAIVGQRWRTIERLVEDPERLVLWPEYRGGLVAQAAKDSKAGKSTVYTNLRLYFQGGQFRNALTPRLVNCGGAGKPRLFTGVKLGRGRSTGEPRAGVTGPGLRDVMLQAIPLLVEGRSMKAAREQVLLDRYGERTEVDGKPEWSMPPEATMPTLRQFSYWCDKELGRGGLSRRRMGGIRWHSDFAAKPGSLRAGLRGPGELYQIDATLGNIFLRSAHNRGRLVGRPVIYLVVDVYTGMIVGYHVCLKPPSVREMRLALENALSDKVEYCAGLGIPIEQSDWPVHHRPGRLLTDGGPEFVAAFLDEVGMDLGFNVSTAPPYDPTKKALVEGKFDLLNTELLEWTPGAYRKRQRGDKPCKLDAKYDLAGFRHAMALWILEHNLKRSAYWPEGWTSPDGSDPTLLGLWSFGVVNNGCPQDSRHDVVRQALLERGEGKLSQTCLRFNKRRYVPVDAAERVVMDQVPGSPFGKRHVRYDARDVTDIQVHAAGGHSTSTWTLAAEDRIYAGCSEDEFEDHQAWRLQGRRQSDIDDIAHKARWRTEQQALARRMAAEMEGIVAKVGPDGVKADRRAETLAASAAARAAAPPSGAPSPAGTPAPNTATAGGRSTPRRSFAPSVVD